MALQSSNEKRRIRDGGWWSATTALGGPPLPMYLTVGNCPSWTDPYMIMIMVGISYPLQPQDKAQGCVLM